MKQILAAAVISLLLVTPLIADISYRIQADINVDTWSMTGSMQLVISAEPGITGSQARLNLQVSDRHQLTLVDLLVNDQTVAVEVVDGQALIPLPAAAGVVTITAGFILAELPDNEGVVLLDDTNRFGSWFTWYPRLVTDMPVAFSYSTEVLVNGPGSLAVSAPSATVEELTGTKIYTLSSQAAHSMAMAFSPIFVERRALIGGCDVGLLVREGSEAWADRMLNALTEAYDFYAEQFPGISRSRLDAVFGPSDYSPASLQPALLVMEDRTDDLLQEFGGVFTTNYLRWQVASTASQVLWGAVLVQSFNEIPWVREGFALFAAERFANSTLLGGPVFDNIRQYYLSAARAGKNTSLTQTIDQAQASGIDAYQVLARSKGFWVVGLLFDQLQGPSFRRLAGRLADTAPAAVNLQQFRRLVDEVSAEDMTQFFDNWITGSSFVDYGIADVQNNAQPPAFTLTREGSVVAPVQVEVYFAGGEREQRTVIPRQQQTRVTFEGQDGIARIRIDPESRLPDINRANNLRSFGGSERIERLYDIDSRFEIGDLRVIGPVMRADVYRQATFDLPIRNRLDRQAALGIEVVAAFPGGRNRGITRLYLELAPNETRTVSDLVKFPVRGRGLAEVIVRFFQVADREQYEAIDRTTDPDLVTWYAVDTENIKP